VLDDAGTAARARRGPLWHSPFFWATLAGLITIPAIRPLLRHEPPPPPVLYALPPFSLVDTRGQPFGSAELEGQVWVVDFIFTRCASICPLLTRAMGNLDRRYRESGTDGVRLVSITVDPGFDTPAVLGEYASAHGIDLDRWTLLSGPEHAIRALITEGFRFSFEEPPRDEADVDLVDIAHTGKLVLVDRSGGVRGLYDIDESGLDELFHRSRRVLEDR
jgi:protein SCO1/2